MKGQFLPRVEVTTIVWAEEDYQFDTHWECAQGDDLQLNRPTIEFNLAKIVERCNYDAKSVAQEMIKHWIAMEVVFGTRQDLINKQVRGIVSDENILYKANFETILSSPDLYEEYKDIAVKAIIYGEHCVYPKNGKMSELFKDIRGQLAAVVAEKVFEESIR